MTLRSSALRFTPAARSPCQFRAECRVGDLDQRAGAFGERAAAQLGNAVLGDDEVGLGARRGDDAIRQARDNARSAAVAGCGL